MNNVHEAFDRILYFDLRPWIEINIHDEKFASLLSSIETTRPSCHLFYQIDFYRPFNYKTDFYHKFILNETNRYINLIVDLVNESENDFLKKYWINDTLNKKLKSRIRDVGNLIRDYDFNTILIDPRKTTFKSDRDHKSNTYIIQLLKISLIQVFLELQEMFKKHLKDNLLLEQDFYTRLLFEPIPEKSFLHPNPKVIEIELIKKAVKEKVGSNITSPKNGKLNSFKYIHLKTQPDYIVDLYHGLRDGNLIESKTQLPSFRKIFSGTVINNPVVWTGSISELHYFIKLIHNINKSVEDLKQHQWEVACICFIKPDGSKFDRIQLKDQKKPKLSAAKLEKIAGHLQ